MSKFSTLTNDKDLRFIDSGQGHAGFKRHDAALAIAYPDQLKLPPTQN
jgi:hypothetical protein